MPSRGIPSCRWIDAGVPSPKARRRRRGARLDARSRDAQGSMRSATSLAATKASVQAFPVSCSARTSTRCATAEIRRHARRGRRHRVRACPEFAGATPPVLHRGGRLRRRGRRALRHHPPRQPRVAGTLDAAILETKDVGGTSMPMHCAALDSIRSARQHQAEEKRDSCLRGAAHRAGAGARGRRPARGRRDRDQRLFPPRVVLRGEAGHAGTVPMACAATRSPPRPSAFSRSRTSQGASRARRDRGADRGEARGDQRHPGRSAVHGRRARAAGFASQQAVAAVREQIEE